jgi:hypothetical protein
MTMMTNAGDAPAMDEGDDVRGFSPHRVVVTVIAKAIVAYATNATPIWSDSYPGFPSGGLNPVPGGSPYGSNGTKLQ